VAKKAANYAITKLRNHQFIDAKRMWREDKVKAGLKRQQKKLRSPEFCG
jgi:hypothetical protein